MAKKLICIAAILFNSMAYGNICIIEPVTVSHMRGHVVYVDGETKSAAGDEISVELWQTGRDGRVLLAKANTDAKGCFSFGQAKTGLYDLVLRSPTAIGGFWVRVKSPNIIHRSWDNWLEIGLGLAQPIGCPPSYIRTLRSKKISSAE